MLEARSARIVLIGRSAPRHALPASLADACLITGVDLSDADAARDAMNTAAQRLGGLNVLVNVAGAFRWETIGDGSADTWQTLFDINVKTALNASKGALAHLTTHDHGRIVNTSARWPPLKAGAGMGAYAASNAALLRLTEALAEELKDRSVTVNTVLPSIIDTPENRKDMPDTDVSRWVKPEQIGAVIGFLLSADAQCITGASIPIAGRI